MTDAKSPPIPTEDPASSTLAIERASQELLEAFADYQANFKAVSREAQKWFEQRQWKQAQAGAVQRLDLYSEGVRQAIRSLADVLGPRRLERDVWSRMKSEYARLIADRNDEELAETFFNSVSRAVLTTMGVDSDVEFVWFDIEILPSGDELPTYRAFHRLNDTRSVAEALLSSYTFRVPWGDLEADAAKVARAVDDYLVGAWVHANFDAIEIADPVFYRNKGAYLVGRIRRGMRVIPLVLPLISTEEGIFVDAVLLEETYVSMVFSFARSYFMVDAVRPVELIGFLRSVLPLKPVAELYIALGYVKHGKTVRYRHFYRHLGSSTDRFRFATGIRGMVMICFTLPSYDIVFKIIRDKFDYPKKSSRREVLASYDLVFKHNRVGRLIDAQEFEHLTFDRSRFDDALLEELRTEAKDSVTITEDQVIIHHVYTERRLNPLNVYVREVNQERADAAVVEYGNALKDLAAANVFAGDLLIKNFGVTRHGRVVFYDYDEVCLLTKCRFRKLPAQHESFGSSEGEVAFFVGDDDIFPEEFRSFLWPSGPLRDKFEQAHPDLFTVEFWRQMQARNKGGEVLDVYPYPQSKRLRPADPEHSA